jgi:hypothetical protein
MGFRRAFGDHILPQPRFVTVFVTTNGGVRTCPPASSLARMW